LRQRTRHGRIRGIRQNDLASARLQKSHLQKSQQQKSQQQKSIQQTQLAIVRVDFLSRHCELRHNLVEITIPSYLMAEMM
jgi:hypothetical protein